MDADIKNWELNDFSVLPQIGPDIGLVCFNESTAGRFESLLREPGYSTKVLPSSSGANRRFSTKRRSEWSSICTA